MSDLPGAMTKQTRSAPPRIMRSTRYSLTARGRSVAPSRRLPTGSSSLERSEEHTSELQSLMRISYAVFCLKKKKPSNKLRARDQQQTMKIESTLTSQYSQ